MPIPKLVADQPIPAGVESLSTAFKGMNKREFCRWIAAYYNGTEIEFEETEIRTFLREVKGIDYNHFHGLERLAALLTIEGSYFLIRKKYDVMKIAAELRRHRRGFQGAVKWLCSPKSTGPLGPDPEKQWKEWEHWLLHTQEGQQSIKRAETGRPYDRASESPLKFLEDHGLRHIEVRAWMIGDLLFTRPFCRHWIDGFCSFLVSECYGRRPPEMPIKLCGLCGGLFVPERSDAKYCKEGGCQRKAFWTDERHRDYEYVRRYLRIADDCTKQRHGFSIAHLRKTLNKPTVKEKLQKIEQLWKEDWPQVSKKAKKLRRIAAELGTPS